MKVQRQGWTPYPQVGGERGGTLERSEAILQEQCLLHFHWLTQHVSEPAYSNDCVLHHRAAQLALYESVCCEPACTSSSHQYYLTGFFHVSVAEV